MALTASSNLIKKPWHGKLNMQFFSTAPAGSTCAAGPRALAPIIHDESITIANGAGATPADLFLGVAGEAAPFGGYVSSTLKCSAYQLELTVITGDDCIDDCDPTPDVLVKTEKITIDVPAGQGVQLPPAYYAQITVKTTDGAGVATNAAVGGDVRFTSSRAGVCGADVVIPA